MGTLVSISMAGRGIKLFLLLLLVDWSLEKPAKRSLRGETNKQIHDLEIVIDHQTNPDMTKSLNGLLGLMKGLVGQEKAHRQRRGVNNNTRNEIYKTEQEIESFLSQEYTSPKLREALEHLIEDLDNFAEIEKKRGRRSSDGWSCSDLAIIVREYDYVINLLETINNFIRDNILTKLNDQMDNEVKSFVTNTLAIYTDAEAQLKPKREPFVQYQITLGCVSSSSTETTSQGTTSGLSTSTAVTITSTTTDVSTSTSSEASTTVSTTINVAEVLQQVVTQRNELQTIINGLDSSTATYSQLTNLLGYLDSLIAKLNQIPSTEIGRRRKRSADTDCDALLAIKNFLEDAIQIINQIIVLLKFFGTTGIPALDTILRELEVYLGSDVLSTLNSYVNKINNICPITTSTAVITQESTTTGADDTTTTDQAH